MYFSFDTDTFYFNFYIFILYGFVESSDRKRQLCLKQDGINTVLWILQAYEQTVFVIMLRKEKSIGCKDMVKYCSFIIYFYDQVLPGLGGKKV